MSIKQIAGILLLIYILDPHLCSHYQEGYSNASYNPPARDIAAGCRFHTGDDFILDCRAQ